MRIVVFYHHRENNHNDNVIFMYFHNALKICNTVYYNTLLDNIKLAVLLMRRIRNKKYKTGLNYFTARTETNDNDNFEKHENFHFSTTILTNDLTT